ncbi:PAS domain S-box protein [Lusitaniella coriacea LEGE 07157]|uniref:histidine kinase n=1 Tax=Lusitaniella coriacea LEGE 07157 TaxID=945747 RepID=A0A8J7AMN1_9CYAN|nr:PAS domain S-box protein [Lusitaniella coriacea]MBE9114663.1 PAS domain S-box protein [Lusitaniella coriacea LEGE 07157]
MNKPAIILIDREITLSDHLKRELSRALENEFEIKTAVGGMNAVDLAKDLRMGDREVAAIISNPKALEGLTRIVNYAIATFQDITPRKQGEKLLARYNRTLAKEVSEQTEALQDSEQRFKNAFETAPIGMYLVSLKGQLMQVNPSVCRILGYSESELLARTFQEITHPEDVEIDLRYVRQLLRGKRPRYHVEKRYVHKNGQIVWALLSVSLVRDVQQQPSYFICQIQDITARKETEEALRASERRYATLTKMSPAGIFRTDPQGNYSFVNDRWCQMTGLTPQLAMGMGWASALHPEDRDRVATDWCRAAQLNLPFSCEYRFMSPDGVVVWVVGQAVAEKDSKGNIISYIGTVTDVSALKQVETALQEKNEALNQTLQELKRTQNELIQSEKMVALGQLIAGVAHEINTPLAAIRSSIEHISDFFDQKLDKTSSFYRHLSSPRQQDFLNLLDRSAQGSATISHREKRQYKRRLIRKLEGDAIANADILADYLIDMGIYEPSDALAPLFQDPNGLSIVKTAYQLTSVKSSAQTITTATDRAAKVVFALKTYAHYDHSERKIPTDILKGIETVLTLYQNQFKGGVKILRRYAPNLPMIWGYPDELNQVWTNLIHNALQAMNNQGRLIFEVVLRNCGICVSVIDSGGGIPQEIQPRIFQPFFTTKPPGEGSGLGLDIAKKIIEKHQGTIGFESEPGKTAFRVCLPLNRPEE